MRYLPQPTDDHAQPYEAGEVFKTCVSMVKNNALKGQLLAVQPNVEAESQDYSTRAARGTLFQKQPNNQIAGVSGDELVKVYTLRMVPKKSTGRSVYNRIMSIPPLGRCPFCGIGTVNTLDHFLPKERFPAFAVTPVNLVACCTWCQGEKHDYYAKSDGEQLLHPYFDNLNAIIWLTAEVVPGSPAAFRFCSSPPSHWPAASKARLESHLKELNLKFLFSSNAGSRLSEIRERLSNLFQKGGANEVRAYLQEELVSLEANQPNSWTAAMYRAALASDWFCNDGFAQ
jgi:hypothetical protein